MKKVFSHERPYPYEDRASRDLYTIPANGWIEMPDNIAELLLRARPEQLCDVTSELNPSEHKCAISARKPAEIVANTAMRVPPEHTQARPLTRGEKRILVSAARRGVRSAREGRIAQSL